MEVLTEAALTLPQFSGRARGASAPADSLNPTTPARVAPFRARGRGRRRRSRRPRKLPPLVLGVAEAARPSRFGRISCNSASSAGCVARGGRPSPKASAGALGGRCTSDFAVGRCAVHAAISSRSAPHRDPDLREPWASMCHAVDLSHRHPGRKAAPAHGFGNTVVLSRQPTPPSAALAGSSVRRARRPRVHMIFARGVRAVGAPRRRRRLLTGSQTVVPASRRAVARQARCSSIMGGKNTLIGSTTPILDRAVMIALDGSFYATGQRHRLRG